ncbi:MAG: DUF4235 domain-containing protein, partial [Bacteroidota bacterium]
MENDKYKEELKIFITNGSALLSAYLLKRFTELILESVFHKEAPKKPDEQEEIGWIEAIGWAAFTGAMAGIIKLVIKRGTRMQLD